MSLIHSLSSSVVAGAPFPWAFVPRLWSAGEALEMERSYPDQKFTQSIGRDEHYRLSDRCLVDESIPQDLEDLTPAWKGLVNQLLSSEYRRSVEALFGIDLQDTHIKLRLCKYEGNCWMKPHTDREDRVITQIIYLSENWQPEWGGHLLLLNSPEEEDVVEDLPPAFNTSVLFARSDTSWHAVQRVEPYVVAERKTILLQFIRNAS